jgi:hypothetical protein
VQSDGTAKAWDTRHRPRWRFLPRGAACDRLVHGVLTDRGADDGGWTVAVRSCEDAIQYRNGMSSDTTPWRVGTQGMTHSTRGTALWAIRLPVSVLLLGRCWAAGCMTASDMSRRFFSPASYSLLVQGGSHSCCRGVSIAIRRVQLLP